MEILPQFAKISVNITNPILQRGAGNCLCLSGQPDRRWKYFALRRILLSACLLRYAVMTSAVLKGSMIKVVPSSLRMQGFRRSAGGISFFPKKIWSTPPRWIRRPCRRTYSASSLPIPRCAMRVIACTLYSSQEVVMVTFLSVIAVASSFLKTHGQMIFLAFSDGLRWH